MFAGEGGGVESCVGRAANEIICGEEGEHHVGRAGGGAEVMADGGEVGWVRGEPGEEIELGDRGGEEIGRVEAVAVAVDGRRVGGGGEGEVEAEWRGHERGGIFCHRGHGGGTEVTEFGEEETEGVLRHRPQPHGRGYGEQELRRNAR